MNEARILEHLIYHDRFSPPGIPKQNFISNNDPKEMVKRLGKQANRVEGKEGSYTVRYLEKDKSSYQPMGVKESTVSRYINVSTLVYDKKNKRFVIHCGGGKSYKTFTFRLPKGMGIITNVSVRRSFSAVPPQETVGDPDAEDRYIVHHVAPVDLDTYHIGKWITDNAYLVTNGSQYQLVVVHKHEEWHFGWTRVKPGIHECKRLIKYGIQRILRRRHEEAVRVWSRRFEERMERKEKKEIMKNYKKIYVEYDDSMTAGNCVPGSQDVVRILKAKGFSMPCAVRADYLYEVAHSRYPSNVTRAISIAYRRISEWKKANTPAPEASAKTA